MKPVPLLIALVSVGIALSAVSWVSRSGTPSGEASADGSAHAPTEKSENPLKISKTGPFPKAVLEEGMHEFGSIELGQKGRHIFVIRNDGDAPLELMKGLVQCKCTVPEIPKDTVISVAPGDVYELPMTWHPEEPMEEFHQLAQIWTNDPENPELELHVKGAVERLFYLLPRGEWQVNRAGDDEAFQFGGVLMSPLLDEFKIVDYTSSTDALSVEFEPFSEADLEVDKMKCGYKIRGSITGETPVGKFRETLTLVTDMAEGREITISLAGMFPGPFSILGKDWIGSLMQLKLGDVKASEGRTAKLVMFVTREDEPIQLEVKEANPSFLQLEIERDESFDVPSREKFLLTFTVPPGSPQGSWHGDDAATIIVGTNRKNAPELELGVEMVVK